jgi:hypothetical protein
MKTAVRSYGASGDPDQTGQQRKKVLLYAFAVILTSTLIVACSPLLHITN